MKAVRVEYDEKLGILEVSLAHLAPSSVADIEDLFQDIRSRWRVLCGDKKVYVLIDYTGFVLARAMQEAFGLQVRKITTDVAIAAVRYTDDLTVRTQMRALAIKIHRPSNIYSTREEALGVIRGLKDRSVALEAG